MNEKGKRKTVKEKEDDGKIDGKEEDGITTEKGRNGE